MTARKAKPAPSQAALPRAIPPQAAEYLSAYINPERRALLERVLARRTRYFTVALEDLHLPRNAGAVIRTLECLGIQDLHVIERDNEYRPDGGIAQGADKWLSVYRYNRRGEDNTARCLRGLRGQGYRIVAMMPDPRGRSLARLDIGRRMAFCFGAEESGLSEAARELADESAAIPLHGLTRSYNVSVSVAITLYTLGERLRDSGVDWRLSAAEKDRLLAEWLARSTAAGPRLLRRFLEGRATPPEDGDSLSGFPLSRE